jgi:hypothetical protein
MANNLKLRALTQEQEWEEFIKLCDELVDRFKSDNILGNSADETLKLVYLQQGRIQGIKMILDYFEKEV